MRIFVNTPLIKRNNLLSKALTIVGIGILIGGLVLSFSNPALMNLSLIAFIVGTILSQLGLAMHNRWVRRPRIDEILDEALKGLDNRYATFHYKLGTNHALISPSGAYALVPRLEYGEIAFDGDRWWATTKKRGLLRRGGRKSIGKIHNGASSEAKSLQRSLLRVLPDRSDISVDPILVFVHHDAVISVPDPPSPVAHLKKLKSLVRRLPKSKSLRQEEIDLLA